MLKSLQLRKVGTAANQSFDGLCPTVHPVTSDVAGRLLLGHLCKQAWSVSFGTESHLVDIRPNKGNAQHV